MKTLNCRQAPYDAGYECYGSFAERGKQAIDTFGG